MAWRPRPGIIPLRPITLGEILDGAFQAIRTNPKTMLGFSALVMVVIQVINLIPSGFLYASPVGKRALDPAAGDPTNVADAFSAVGATMAASVIPLIVTFLGTTVLDAILVVAVSAAVLGQRMTPGQLWARVRPRIWAALGLALLEGLAIGGLVLVLLLPGFAVLLAGSLGGGIALIVVGGIVAFVGALWIQVSWSLAGPALLLENQSVTGALRRSWQLVRGTWWRVFGIRFVVGIITGIGTGIISVPFNLVGQGLLLAGVDGNLALLLVGLAVTAIGSIIAGSVFYPFTAAATALLYVDVRMRREGLDVELMRAVETPSATLPGTAG